MSNDQLGKSLGDQSPIETAKLSPLQSPYSKVYVHLLAWDTNDTGARNEQVKLQTVLQDRFGFEVQQGIIQAQHPVNLLIFAYSGHGQLDLKKTFKLVPALSRPGELKWKVVAEALDKASCDVLMLIDACYAGSVIDSFHEPHAKYSRELLAACNYKELSISGASRLNFSVNLRHSLEDLAEQGKPFSISKLHRTMSLLTMQQYCRDVSQHGFNSRVESPTNSVTQKWCQPTVHYLLNENINQSIVLSPLPTEEQKDFTHRPKSTPPPLHNLSWILSGPDTEEEESSDEEEKEDDHCKTAVDPETETELDSEIGGENDTENPPVVIAHSPRKIKITWN